MREPLTLLVGGRSTEHDASLCSYRSVLAAVTARPDLFVVDRVCYIALDGSVRLHAGPEWPVDEAALGRGPALSIAESIAELTARESFCFSLLHGNEGEDGAWQGLAEIIGLRGNFGPVLPSALCMDKWMQSFVARATGVDVPRTEVVHADADDSALDRVIATFAGTACVIKPNRMGASLLTTRHEVLTRERLRVELARIAPWDDQVLVQQFIRGVEYTCGCISDGATIRALPVIEARTAHGFLGHQEKHAHGGVEPVLLPDGDRIATVVQEACCRLFAALRLFAMCRFDLIRTVDGRLYYLEANSLPGLMSGSAFPCMLRAAGLDLTDLVQTSIAAERRLPRRRKSLRYVIDHEVST